MNATELDTFVFKFKHLWKAGLDAHLDLECHAGQAWVGIRVRLGQDPGPNHHHHIPPQPRKTRDGPSRQRRRARRAAARQYHAGEAVKENVTSNVKEAVEAVENENDAAEVEPKEVLTDEFCPDADYAFEDLNDENSETFRFVIKEEPSQKESLKAFESRIKQNFVNNKVEDRNQIFIISGYEQLEEQTKLYIKVKNNSEVLAAVRKMKSENTFLRKLPTKRKKP